MDRIIRKGIAFQPDELERFDKAAKKKGYKNRSEAIRDLIREALVEKESDEPDQVMMAAFTMVYDHHDHRVQYQVTHIQHHHPEITVSAMHMHMDHDNCMEVLVMKGTVREITKLADNITATKGVKHGKLTLISAC